MRLLIRLQDGQPFEHPILESNFKQAFLKVDLDNLPDWVAEFQRIEKPPIKIYEVYEGVTYEWFNGVVKDVHHVRSMTEEEKTAKQNEVKAQWAQHGFASWIFNEDTCSFDPPVTYPNDGNPYRWDEETTSWIQPE